MAQRFERVHIQRLTRFHNMLYRPSEVAQELEVTTETVLRSYLPGGCPFTRDKVGAIWIHGPAFAGWVRSVNQRKKLGSLAEGQAWCFKCSKPVEMLRSKRKHLGRYTAIYQGRCAECGQVVNRAYAASAKLEGSSARRDGETEREKVVEVKL